MRKINLKFLFFSLYMITYLTFSYAETFRISKLRQTTIDLSGNSEQTVKVGINEAIAVYLPEDRTFFEGIEIKMAIPEEIASWRDSVACLVYNGVKPKPVSNQIDYSGTRSYVSTLPGKLSWILQIPFTTNHHMKSNQYTTTIDAIPDISGNYVFLRLQPIMKGIPEETMKSQVSMTVKPVLINKGRLNLSLTSGEANIQPYSVYIDETPADTTKPLLLNTGVHNISILSENYRSEFRTVRIDQAKTTTLEIPLKSIEPTLLIIAPEGTKLLLDDKPFENFGNEFIVNEGEHKIKVTIGDYEIVRSISVTKGKTYTANFTVDLQISEE